MSFINISAGNTMIRSLNFPYTDSPHAPLADAFEVDDFLLDDVKQYCNFQVTNSTDGKLEWKYRFFFSIFFQATYLKK